jgi:hypothetical protein
MLCILFCSLELGLTIDNLCKYTIAFLVGCNPLLDVETLNSNVKSLASLVLELNLWDCLT